MTTLTRDQKRTFRADYELDGKPCVLVATVRYDDQCGNGHNTFSITGDFYHPLRQQGEPTIQSADGRTLWLNSCGCLHEEISQHFPELAPLVKWHLCSSDGPMHYVANTVYHASDKDCWGLRKGEFKRQYNKEGLPLWYIAAEDYLKPVGSFDPPAPVAWKPKGTIGEGKERDLDAARSSAIWPEATDAELTADDLPERLQERLPKLLEEFRAAVESLGFVW